MLNAHCVASSSHTSHCSYPETPRTPPRALLALAPPAQITLPTCPIPNSPPPFRGCPTFQHSPSPPATVLSTPAASPSSPSSHFAAMAAYLASRAGGLIGSALDQGSSSPEVVSQDSPSPSSHRRSRSREFWSSHFGSGMQKAVQPEEEESVMEVDEMEPPITLEMPESLPACSMSAVFRSSESDGDIPPAFYPGQAIPTILTFQLDRDSCLRHSLNPTLTMSLVGTLHVPDSDPRTIICVSVSLAEGLALWARDAAHAYAGRAASAHVPDVTLGLPGGTYSLPLTVQVPTSPRLPPTFCIAGATFGVTYALNVTLTCDDPHRWGNRVVLAETGRPFEMLPETLPSRPPRFAPQSFWVRMGMDATGPGAVGVKGNARLGNYRWSVKPILPTTTYSPTSTIPLELEFMPPPELPDQQYQILIRLSIVRREHTSFDGSGAVDPTSNERLVSDREVVVRWGWIEADGHSSVRIPKIDLPLMLGSQWRHGFSTMLNVGSARAQYGHNHVTEHSGISVASTFHLCITLAFLPLGLGGGHASRYPQSLRDALPPAAVAQMLPSGVFGPAESPEATAIPLGELRRGFPGTVRTLPIPVVVGSVAEPRGALHTRRWSDLHLDRRNGRERGRMIHGESLSCEDGWMCPPPSYGEAVRSSPYVYDVARGGESGQEREREREREVVRSRRGAIGLGLGLGLGLGGLQMPDLGGDGMEVDCVGGGR